MKNMKFTLAVMAVVLLWVVGCSKDDGPEMAPAAFSVDKNTIDFGEVEIGSIKKVKIKITNTGEDDLVLKDYLLSSADTSGFSVNFSESEVILPADGTYEMDVNFSPIEEGENTSVLTIVSNIGEHRINLSGRGDLGANAIVHIPDDNFKAGLLAHGDSLVASDISIIDTNGDGEIQVGEAEAYTGRIACVGMGITDLTGIEAFLNIKVLTLVDNQLTSLDVSKNIALEKLVCDSNELTGLDVSKNTALIELWVQSNKLSALDISKNVALKRLYCDNNQLTNLDVSNNTALEQIWAQNNALTNLDVSKNVALEKLYLSNNNLTSLDISFNTALNTLAVQNNQLTTLDVANNTGLYDLAVHNNQLMDLDVSKNTELKHLTVTNNEISNLNTSMNILLEDLSCDGNNLTTLDLSQNKNLWELRCNYNQITSLDISNNAKLQLLACVGNQLTSLNVSQNVALRTFACGANRLTSLRLVDNTELRSLRCEQNQLTSLNLANGNNSLLTNVSATENNLDCIQIDEGFTPPNDSSWLKDDTASYSSLCP
jgi:Leucine-rich repeat (LRR) protein